MSDGVLQALNVRGTAKAPRAGNQSHQPPHKPSAASNRRLHNGLHNYYNSKTYDLLPYFPSVHQLVAGSIFWNWEFVNGNRNTHQEEQRDKLEYVDFHDPLSPGCNRITFHAYDG